MNIFALLLGVRHKASPSPGARARFFLFLLLKVVYSARPRKALARTDPSSSTSCTLLPPVYCTYLNSAAARSLAVTPSFLFAISMHSIIQIPGAFDPETPAYGSEGVYDTACVRVSLRTATDVREWSECVFFAVKESAGDSRRKRDSGGRETERRDRDKQTTFLSIITRQFPVSLLRARRAAADVCFKCSTTLRHPITFPSQTGVPIRVNTKFSEETHVSH